MVNIYFYPSVRAAQASHTRLCQLADFPSVRAAQAFILRSRFAHPSLNLRSTFAQGSLGEIMNFEF